MNLYSIVAVLVPYSTDQCSGTVCPHLLCASFLAILTAPITIPTTSSVARTPKTVPPTNTPMVAAVADCSGEGPGLTNGIFCSVTEWRKCKVLYIYVGEYYVAR